MFKRNASPSHLDVARPGFLRGLFRRFFYFFGQTVAVILLTGVIFALTGSVSFLIVKRYVQGQEVLVPNVMGKKVEDAARYLWDDGVDLSVKIEGFDYSDLVAEGEIVMQTPQPGNYVKTGTVVRVRVSKGTTLIPCPDVRGSELSKAGISLREADLNEGDVSHLPSSEAREGFVIAQSPPPNAVVERQTEVDLLVSTGPPAVAKMMPSLLDLTVSEAEGALLELNLRISAQDERPLPGKDNGLIQAQYPAPGAPVTERDEIRVTTVRNEVL
ncbi:PASTA domain-containing protein [bacterium]|nr:PASTA domain-containing protein [bacterium]